MTTPWSAPDGAMPPSSWSPDGGADAGPPAAGTGSAEVPAAPWGGSPPAYGSAAAPTVTTTVRPAGDPGAQVGASGYGYAGAGGQGAYGSAGGHGYDGAGASGGQSPAVDDPFRVGGLGPNLRPTPVPWGQYQQHLGYAAYGPAPVWAAPRRTDPMAVTSLVLAICGVVVLPVLLPQVALVLGLVALRRTRRTGDDGRGMAIAGVVIGGLVTLGAVLLVAFFISAGTV
ncbi:DUF4190 domain-containing protein [Actinotalea sp. AC32]|nr:DUF4190 domain-containing protein [Actinotalea sp. AC32]